MQQACHLEQVSSQAFAQDLLIEGDVAYPPEESSPGN
jgi:hypothetical protein